MANRRILWVDEDFFFLEYVQQALEYLGHQPLLATHDSEAWRIFQKDSQAIDLVVLETTRADSCRQDLYRNLFQLNPNLRALLITSPASASLPMGLIRDARIGTLDKPFTIQELSKKIEDMLPQVFLAPSGKAPSGLCPTVNPDRR